MTIPTKAPVSSLLVQQDICLAREEADGSVHVVATVACARRGLDVAVEECAHCPHFARIETHEAGYVMLCRTDSNRPPPPVPENESGG